MDKRRTNTDSSLTPEGEAMLYATMHGPLSPTRTIMEYLKDAWLAGYNSGQGYNAEPLPPYRIEKPYDPRYDDMNTRSYPADPDSRPMTQAELSRDLTPTLPESTPENTANWRPVIHAFGPGACNRPALFVIERVSRYKPGKLRQLRLLDGTQPIAGKTQMVCGSCGLEIVFWSAKYLRWEDHYLGEREERELDRQENTLQDPRSPQAIQAQHAELAKTLEPLAGALPNAANLGPRIENGRIVIDPSGVPHSATAISPESDIPYIPYPATGPITESNDPWNNIGQMMAASATFHSVPPTDEGLPPNHPDRAEPLPALPTDALLDLALQVRDSVQSDTAIQTAPAGETGASGQPAQDE